MGRLVDMAQTQRGEESTLKVMMINFSEELEELDWSFPGWTVDKIT